jgi:hypothetical protein
LAFLCHDPSIIHEITGRTKVHSIIRLRASRLLAAAISTAYSSYNYGAFLLGIESESPFALMSSSGDPNRLLISALDGWSWVGNFYLHLLSSPTVFFQNCRYSVTAGAIVARAITRAQHIFLHLVTGL